MRTTRALLALAALGVPALFISTAWGDDTQPASPASADASAPSAPATTARASGDAGAVRHDPDNKTGIAEWMEKCVEGNKRYLGKDIPGAIDSYRQAIQLAPKQPIPHYLLAEAQLGANNLPEAETAIKDAEATSSDRDANTRGKILFVTADLFEREKKWPDAKTAWTAYADFAAKHADAGVALSTPTARVQAIDDMLKQDKAYEAVRQRIADESKDAGPAAAPDAGKKK